MALFEKNKNKSPKAAPISDNDPVFLAVLTGLIAKHGCIDSEGKPSIMVVDMAKQFLKEMRKDT